MRPIIVQEMEKEADTVMDEARANRIRSWARTMEIFIRRHNELTTELSKINKTRLA